MSRLDSRMSEMRYRNGFSNVLSVKAISPLSRSGYGCFTVDGRFRFRRTLFGSFDQSEQVVAAAPVDFELGADAGGIDSANIVLHRAQIAVPQVEIERIDVDDPVVAAVAQFQPRCGRYAVRAQVEQVVGVAFHMQVECDEALYRADVDHLIEIGRCACQREVRKQQTEVVVGRRLVIFQRGAERTAPREVEHDAHVRPFVSG